MIRRTVSAALLLRDGFTGKTLRGGTAAFCLLDDRPLRRPIWKKDGYLVLTDLAPGEHVLCIRANGYRDELVPLRVEEGVALEDTVSLKPGAGYRFPPETVRAKLSVRRSGCAAAGAQVWLGLQQRTKLKLARENAAGGDASARLFCDGSVSLLPVPGHFLVADPDAQELVYLRSLRGETGEFASPLAHAHARGTELVPVQPYTADAAGSVQVLLSRPGLLTCYCEGKVFTAQLGAGDEKLEWELEG